MRVTPEMVERALKATPLVDGDKFAPAIQGLFLERRRTILRAALEAALADVPEPIVDGHDCAHWRRNYEHAEEECTAEREMAQQLESKLAKVRAAAQLWAKSAADKGYADGARVAWQSCAIEVADILDEAP